MLVRCRATMLRLDVPAQLRLVPQSSLGAVASMRRALRVDARPRALATSRQGVARSVVALVNLQLRRSMDAHVLRAAISRLGLGSSTNRLLERMTNEHPKRVDCAQREARDPSRGATASQGGSSPSLQDPGSQVTYQVPRSRFSVCA